ncbi:MAG: hypothetical protein HY606_00260 [Planctomycetes bacterium]|nr:hypothetical protein [Planctomycetota bacterium]
MVEKTLKATVVMPKKMNEEMRERIFKEGYGMRGKSEWVIEAVGSLLEMDGYEDLVNYSDEMRDFKAVETVVISRDLKSKIDASALKIRKKYPTLEGIQSRIFRTSILQRLLRPQISGHLKNV